MYCCLLWRIIATIRNRFEVNDDEYGEICECRLWKEMVMVFDYKNVVLIGQLEQIVKKEKARKNVYV